MDNATLSHLFRAHAGRIAASGLLATAIYGCAAEPTPELKDARHAYDRADNSEVREHNPGELARAREALDRAEDAHDENPGSAQERRLAERAEYRANLAAARTENAHRVPGERVTHVDTTADTDLEREQVAVERERIAAERDRLAAERARDRADTHREVAEPRAAKRPQKVEQRRATSALQNLGSVASVKEEPRGVVITLSGQLLFPTGEERMSPVARQNLDQVARALAEQPDDTKFDVAGHTDDSGSDAENQRLAKERAQQVADHLVASGIDRSRINVVGYGESQPIAGNDTPQGRATNRRVEIVVHQG